MTRIGPELLSELLDEHAPALVLYAQQWCEVPEDVVQEAFLGLVQLDGLPANVVGWLYRVVRNGAVSALRSASRRRRREAQAAKRGEPWFVATDETRLDAAVATDAMRELPIEQRETIVARLWGGLSFDDIAALTETSTSTAHRRYEAGLRALRERFEVSCPKKNPNRKDLIRE